MNDSDLKKEAAALLEALRDSRMSIATAESCTGGWVAKTLTDIPGSSDVFAYGIVSYSNAAKESLLGVQPSTLSTHGAVSEAVVREMAQGAINISGADIAVAISGVAGPGGGSDAKPVGTVWMAWALRRSGGCEVFAELHRYQGDRDEVRTQGVLAALRGAHERLGQHG
ncbi:MAG: CinA family protein [Woeseia sp.]|nr:CinA family protein [Woeseia sp.]